MCIGCVYQTHPGRIQRDVHALMLQGSVGCCVGLVRMAPSCSAIPGASMSHATEVRHDRRA